MSLCLIVLVCGTATYNTTKFITKILQKYCGKISSFVKYSKNSIQNIGHLSINPEEESLVSFDVSALFTSIPVPVALQVINSKTSTCTSFTQCLQDPYGKKSSDFWNLLLPAASSALVGNSINNYKVEPWIHLSPQALQISTWNTLNP